MYVMLTDETNREPGKDAKFFVYGGLIFPIEAITIFDNEIGKIRDNAGYKIEDEFKFDTHLRPEHVSRESCTEAKQAVILLCKEVGCKFIVHIIHHEIIKNQDITKQTLWAADYVIGRYNLFLDSEVKDDGICIVDNLPVKAPYKYLTDKFTKGLIVNGKKILLNRIKYYAATTVGAGHANSAMDIVLGSFRYCINNPHNMLAAKGMMGDVVELMWLKRIGDTYYSEDKGLIIRPPRNKIRFPQIKIEYDNLVLHINKLLEDT